MALLCLLQHRHTNETWAAGQMIEQRQQSLKQNTTPCHLADWAFPAALDWIHREDEMVTHVGMWASKLFQMNDRCLTWLPDLSIGQGLAKRPAWFNLMPAARKNALRLSQGEQAQDLQAALAKAVKEANYLKAHWTLAAGLPCADFVEDSFEVHWSTSLRYANVNNLILILLESSNCKRLRGQHGREATHVFFSCCGCLLKFWQRGPFGWVLLFYAAWFAYIACWFWKLKGWEKQTESLSILPRSTRDSLYFTFILPFQPCQSLPLDGIRWWGFYI